jgi:hypothetical protein
MSELEQYVKGYFGVDDDVATITGMFSTRKLKKETIT